MYNITNDECVSFDELCGGCLAAIDHMSSLLALKKYTELGYSWINYAMVWETDHNLPFSNLDNNSTQSFVFLINHYTNICPMEHYPNLKKGGRNVWNDDPESSPSY